jgi:hypothetical protein
MKERKTGEMGNRAWLAGENLTDAIPNALKERLVIAPVTAEQSHLDEPLLYGRGVGAAGRKA